MRALAATAFDGLDAYHEIDLETPEAGPGELRIAVRAVGLGYVDALNALGRYQVKPPLPHIPGQEIAGVVDALGPGVTGWAVGDRVMALAPRACAEFALARASAALRVPDGLADVGVAVLPMNYLTALHGLVDRGKLQPGETLLVFGAAGGVGSAAVQVGRRLGARVIAVASTQAKRTFASACGADAVLDSEVEGWRDRLRGLLGGAPLNVVFDPLCGPLFEAAFRSLGWGGRHLVVGFVGGPIPALPSNLTLMKGAAMVGVDLRQFQAFEPEPAVRGLAQLLGWVADGSLRPPAGRVFAWDEGRDALLHAFSGEGCGKTVVVGRMAR